MTKRIGTFCFHHPWKVLLVSVILMAGGFVCAGLVTSDSQAGGRSYAPESVRALRTLQQSGDHGGQVVALVEGVSPQARQTQVVLTTAARDVRGLSGVARVDPPRVASDGSGTALPVTLEQPERDGAVRRVADRLRKISDGLPSAKVRIGGDAAAKYEAHATARKDLWHAELGALPLMLIVVFLVFGLLFTASVPLIAALVAVGCAHGVLLLVSRVADLDWDTTAVVTLLALGLSLGYGLLLVARYQEELVPAYRKALVAGRNTVDHQARAEAVKGAWSTEGRVILFGSLAVATSLGGLFLLRVPALQAVALAGAGVTLVAVTVPLTVVAALLGAFGRRVRPDDRSVRRFPDPHLGVAATERGCYAKMARFTQRRPVMVILFLTGFLLAAAAPLLNVTLRLPGTTLGASGLESTRVDSVLVDKYGLTVLPAVFVVARTSPERLNAWAARWHLKTQVEQDGPEYAALSFAVNGDPQGAPAQALVKRTRTDRPPSAGSWVGGEAAQLVDVDDTLKDRLPWGLAVTLAATMALLYLMTRSAVAPLKAIALSLVPLAAAFCTMALAFESHGLDLFAAAVVGALTFGLALDHEVFRLGRIKDCSDRRQDADTAMRHGLQHTGRIITSVAVLLLIVFGSLAAVRAGEFREMGVGLVVAVLVDATLVRCLLVPAVVTLLGRTDRGAPWRRSPDDHGDGAPPLTLVPRD